MAWIDPCREMMVSRAHRLPATARKLAQLAGVLVLLMAAGFVGHLARAWQTGGVETGPDDDMEIASMSISPDGQSLDIDGDFADGTARQLRRVLRQTPGIRFVTLRSEGGLVDEAEQVGDIIAARSLAAYVSDYCVSACTLAFIRARERIISPDAKLGFHAPWEPGARGEEIQVPSADEREAYVAAGIAPDFVDRALAVPSTGIWFPTAEELVRAGVVGAVLSPTQAAERIARFRSDYAGIIPHDR